MHCIDPGCVGACMLGALQKREYGIVTWDPDLCIGCRYCQMACPFNVPKFEWSKKAPKIVKCELCNHRLAQGKEPACSEVCPRQAVIFGKYTDLLDEAHRRLAESPDRYVPKVYGEHDLGGTQVLYLSHVPFEKLGFRFSDDKPVPETQQSVQHAVYKGFAAPLALYAVLGAVMFRNRKTNEKEDKD
jgi:Fe-S-cluster-containing dehydrogenase component